MAVSDGRCIEDEIDLSGLRVMSQLGALIVDSEKDVRVYTTSGTKVYSGMSDNVRINLQSGVYVIVSGEKVVKCIVQVTDTKNRKKYLKACFLVFLLLMPFGISAQT